MVQPIEASWKNVRTRVEIGTYTGDGSTSGRTITLGFTPGLVVILQNNIDGAAITTNTSNHLFLDTTSALTEAAENTDTKITNNGFTVGDGNDNLNVNTENYQYLAFKQSGEARLSWKNVLQRIEFGQYTGDGSTTGREISTGWASDFTFIQTDGSANFWFTMNQTNSAQAAPGLGTTFAEESEVHNSSNGFTVGDGGNAANQNTVTYNYIAINLSGATELAWKNDRLHLELSTYTGDGTSASGGRTIDVGFESDFVFVQEDASARAWVVTGENGGTGLQLSPTLADSVQTTTEVHDGTNGFTVGDGGTTANTDTTVYNYLAIGVV